MDVLRPDETTIGYRTPLTPTLRPIVRDLEIAPTRDRTSLRGFLARCAQQRDVGIEQLRDLGERHGFAEQIALAVFALLARQERELLERLDPFRANLEIQ